MVCSCSRPIAVGGRSVWHRRPTISHFRGGTGDALRRPRREGAPSVAELARRGRRCSASSSSRCRTPSDRQQGRTRIIPRKTLRHPLYSPRERPTRAAALSARSGTACRATAASPRASGVRSSPALESARTHAWRRGADVVRGDAPHPAVRSRPSRSPSPPRAAWCWRAGDRRVPRFSGATAPDCDWRRRLRCTARPVRVHAGGDSPVAARLVRRRGRGCRRCCRGWPALTVEPTSCTFSAARRRGDRPGRLPSRIEDTPEHVLYALPSMRQWASTEDASSSPAINSGVSVRSRSSTHRVGATSRPSPATSSATSGVDPPPARSGCALHQHPDGLFVTIAIRPRSVRRGPRVGDGFNSPALSVSWSPRCEDLNVPDRPAFAAGDIVPPEFSCATTLRPFVVALLASVRERRAPGAGIRSAQVPVTPPSLPGDPRDMFGLLRDINCRDACSMREGRTAPSSSPTR